LFLFDNVKKSHYEVLGVSAAAGDDEIKRAYFGLVRKYQPDLFPEEFKEIRAAYETLRDGQKRAEYDAIGHLPDSVAPLFHEALRLDRLGRRGKAAELYRIILKSHPELDHVREEYAFSLSADDKTGKAVEEWEELCRRQPQNPQYVRELGVCYFDRGWHKKAMTEARRALTLDRSSISGWSLLLSCTVENFKGAPGLWNNIDKIVNEALEALKDVKTNEWKKIPLHAYGVFAAGIEKIGNAGKHIREIIRLTREGGREGRNSGQEALLEILILIPANSLAALYPDLKQLADLLPDLPEPVRERLNVIRLGFEIESLEKNNFHEIFYDLFMILNSDIEEEGDELELTAMEYHLLEDKKTFEPQIRRLKEEFPELYALHGAFFDAALRVRDPEKMLYQRMKKYKKLTQKNAAYDDEDDDPYSPPSKTVRRSQPKVGRNDPCPCGSGKKYKHCCGA
jgi:tetratricopeptide (TPR) repeat protein